MSQPVPEMECFMAEKVLEVNQIKANIEEKEILHGVDLSVGAGEVHVLMGPTFKCIIERFKLPILTFHRQICPHESPA